MLRYINLYEKFARKTVVQFIYFYLTHMNKNYFNSYQNNQNQVKYLLKKQFYFIKCNILYTYNKILVNLSINYRIECYKASFFRYIIYNI